MSKALTVQEDKQVKGLLASNLNAIKSVLPKHLPPEKMARMAYTAIVKTPDLARCSQLSLFNAVLEAASIGLEIGGPLGHAHLIPFKGKATLIVDYKGLIELAYKSPKVKAFTAQPVYENDEFSYNYGLHKDLIHRPAQGPKGKLTHAYAIVEFMGGGFDFEVVTQVDAMAAKENSPAKNKPDSPWNVPKHEWTMWVKTAVRKLMKRIPKNAELQRAMNMDENPDANTDNFIDVDFTTMKEIKGKTVTGDDVPTEEGDQTEEGTTTGAAACGNGGAATGTALTEKEMKILANLEVCKSDSVLAEMYEAACGRLKLDPKADHAPAVAEQILNEMREKK